MSKSGAHAFTIRPSAAQILNGFRFQCPHVHVSGRRCAVRTLAKGLYCDTHALNGAHLCDECRAMAASFGLTL